MRVDWHKHPEASTKPLLDIEEQIFHAAIDAGVLVIRGSWFRAEDDAGKELFFRATFAAATGEHIAEAIKRFGNALRLIFGLEGEHVPQKHANGGLIGSARDGEEKVPLA
jgi:aromatic amino acid aminotransferase I